MGIANCKVQANYIISSYRISEIIAIVVSCKPIRNALVRNSPLGQRAVHPGMCMTEPHRFYSRHVSPSWIRPVSHMLRLKVHKLVYTIAWRCANRSVPMDHGCGGATRHKSYDRSLRLVQEEKTFQSIIRQTHLVNSHPQAYTIFSYTGKYIKIRHT
jgi:hypothetical protein